MTFDPFIPKGTYCVSREYCFLYVDKTAIKLLSGFLASTSLIPRSEEPFSLLGTRIMNGAAIVKVFCINRLEAARVFIMFIVK